VHKVRSYVEQAALPMPDRYDTYNRDHREPQNLVFAARRSANDIGHSCQFSPVRGNQEQRQKATVELNDSTSWVLRSSAR
jgi:hypothetical protein